MQLDYYLRMLCAGCLCQAAAERPSWPPLNIRVVRRTVSCRLPWRPAGSSTIRDSSGRPHTVSETLMNTRTVSEALIHAHTVSEALMHARTVSEALIHAHTVSETLMHARTVSEALMQTRMVSEALMHAHRVSEALIYARTGMRPSSRPHIMKVCTALMLPTRNQWGHRAGHIR